MLTTPLHAGGVGVAHGRSEEGMCRRPPRPRRFRVHYFHGLDALGEEANPAIDLAQPPFAVLIIGVLAAIAVARRPGDYLGHRRPFPTEQKAQLVSESLQANRCDVVLVGFLRERLAHVAGPIHHYYRATMNTKLTGEQPSDTLQERRRGVDGPRGHFPSASVATSAFSRPIYGGVKAHTSCSERGLRRRPGGDRDAPYPLKAGRFDPAGTGPRTGRAARRGAHVWRPLSSPPAQSALRRQAAS